MNGTLITRQLITALPLVCLALASATGAKEIGPDSDLCAEINGLPPGEELVLEPGEYEGPCAIRNGGTADEPLVIRAKDPALRPRIVYMGSRANVLNIAASYVTIRGLAFGPTLRDVDGIRVLSGDFVTVEDCEFEGLGGIAVVSSHQSSQRLTIRRNEVANSRATAVYIGCHSGITCALDHVLVESNYIHGVNAPDPEIGYGIQIKLNSWGWVRDNVIMNTKGPGIMVYGSRTPGKVSVIERNAVSGSRQSAAIVVGGGPAIVRNNVVTDSAEGGIQLEDYRKRGLLREIAIVHNTVYNNHTGGITLPRSAPMTNIWIVNNTVHARPGMPPFPSPGNGLLSLGNANCSLARCFRDPERRDFSPPPGSHLIGAAVPRFGSWMPRDDFTGARRGAITSVGAFEGPAAPIPIGFKEIPR